MTEAVIVATARTPIGRAFKGSLKDVRPDDLSTQVDAGLLDKLPGLDPATIDDLYWGCADPSGKHGSNLARVIAVLAGIDQLRRGRRSTASAPARPRPRGWRSTRSGRARATPSSSGGVECVSQYSSFAGAGGSDADTRTPPSPMPQPEP